MFWESAKSTVFLFCYGVRSMCTCMHVYVCVCHIRAHIGVQWRYFLFCPLLGVYILFCTLLLSWQRQLFYVFPSVPPSWLLICNTEAPAKLLPPTPRWTPALPAGDTLPLKLWCSSGDLSTEHTVWVLLRSPPAFWCSGLIWIALWNSSLCVFI